MSIYESSSTTKKRTNSEISKSSKEIRNNKDLTSIVKQMKNGPKTAKEVLFDHVGNTIGVLQRNNEPYFFSQTEVKEFIKIQKG
jgi:hypothetical protein